LRLDELADKLHCRLEGDGGIEIRGVAGIEAARQGELSFYVNPRYSRFLETTGASALVLADGAPPARCAMLRSANPYLAFARALELFHPAAVPPPGIHPTAIVASTARLASEVSIGPYAVIGDRVVVGARTVIGPHVVIGDDSTLGADVRLHARVSVRERVSLGDRVIVQDGAVIGADGFGFARREDGSHQKIPQVGRVVIEDDVEIGACTTVDRPSVGETRVGRGTKIDNLVQIAHGVTIGRHVLLAAQVGIAGSTVIEDQVMLGGQVGVAGHLTVGRGAVATAQTGIPSSIEPGALVSGYPAIDNRAWLRASAVFRKLPQLKKTLSDLDARLVELERRLGQASKSVR
jgi:UDP-3-O-[3-hydroxymyristoyl] glucosamine N-acyltransferase